MKKHYRLLLPLLMIGVMFSINVSSFALTPNVSEELSSADRLYISHRLIFDKGYIDERDIPNTKYYETIVNGNLYAGTLSKTATIKDGARWYGAYSGYVYFKLAVYGAEPVLR